MAPPVRVPPLDRSQWPDGYRELIDATVERTDALEAGRDGERQPVGILPVLANHPTLMGPFLRWAETLAYGVLSRRDHEILALRAAYRARSEFEYGHHVAYARGAGLGEDEIEGIRAGPGWPGWGEHERALLEAADELLDGCSISDPVWRTLGERLSTEQLIEVPFIVGQYLSLSLVTNALGVQLEDGYERLPDPPADRSADPGR